ncbi:MAG TPA: patatin-like phospholipase family protein [Acidimicrobiales bacterium]|jgi:NTE family protein|nr:patatin-like phospholipase family protein [Acidimicrobiales bacterium]
MSRALVLSGGGSVGIAWQSGLVVGLKRAGVELSEADFIVGTSAGSAVGAQLASGVDLEERLQRYSRDSESDSRGSGGSGGGAAMAENLARLMTVMAGVDDHETEEAGRAAIGKFALEAQALPEDRFVAGFSELADKAWPDRYACTAVDAETGEFVVWDAAAGAPLDRAVASSCAVPGIFEPITINGRRYIDGGMRSGTNADLAAGHDVVVLLTLMDPERMRTVSPERAARYLKRIERELDVLTSGGATVEMIAPNDAAAAVMGFNLMDASLAPAAAEAGLRQASSVADRVGSVWGG